MATARGRKPTGRRKPAAAPTPVPASKPKRRRRRKGLARLVDESTTQINQIIEQEGIHLDPLDGPEGGVTARMHQRLLGRALHNWPHRLMAVTRPGLVARVAKNALEGRGKFAAKAIDNLIGLNGLELDNLRLIHQELKRMGGGDDDDTPRGVLEAMAARMARSADKRSRQRISIELESDPPDDEGPPDKQEQRGEAD